MRSLMFLVTLALLRTFAAEASPPTPAPQYLCPTCFPPPPTPVPTWTPLIKNDPTVPISPNGGYNYHDVYTWFTPTLDIYAQVHISGFGVNSSDKFSFLTNEIWREDSTTTPTYWTEIGFTSGPLQKVFFNGLFGAYYQPTGYYEFAIAANPVQNGNSYGAGVSLATELQDSSIIDFNYNGVTWHSVKTTTHAAGSATIGMESNSSLPQFNAWLGEIDIVAPQIYAPNGSNWFWWPANVSSLGTLNDSPPGEAISNWLASDPRYTPNEPHPAFNY